MNSTHIVSYFQNKIFYFIEKESVKPFFVIRLSLLTTITLIFFATPAYHYINEAFQQINWDATLRKANNPLDTLRDIPAGTHAAKKVFRITVPLIIGLFSLTPLSVYLMQFILGIFTFAILYFLFQNILKDRVSATLLSVGLGFIYFGKACFIDLFSWFDGWAFFFLLLGMLVKHPTIIFVFTFSAAWTDERAVLILPILILFHQINNFSNFDTKQISSFININLRSLSVFLALVIYIAGRLLLSFHFDMHTPSVNANFMRMFDQTDFWGFGIWSFLEGFWILVLMSLIVMLKNKDYLLFTFIMIPIIIFSIVANMVNDVTRSGSYLVPILFIVIPYLYRSNDLNSMRRILLWSVTISFLFPAYAIITDIKPYFLWYKPVFIRFIDFLYLHCHS